MAAKILIVDDEPDLELLIRQRFRREVREGLYEFLFARNGEEALAALGDNGDGIPPAVRAKLFTPFFTTKPAGAGTGLGLSISYDIVVQLHKGSLRVESEERKYAEFIVTLPRAGGAA
jgi:signal transduction histidine kinase